MTETNVSEGENEYVLVTEYFTPDTASTGQLMTELAVGLQERGLDMTVYTGQPNYHSGENQKQPRRSSLTGVEIRRYPVPQLRQSSLRKRAFNWVVFTLATLLVLLIDRTDRDRELLFVSNPPFLPLVVWLVHRIRGWEYTYIVYDLYPDTAVKLGYIDDDGIAHRLWGRIHEVVLRDANNVVALGPVMRNRLIEQAPEGTDPEKFTVIHNWEDGDTIVPRSKEDNWFSREHGLDDTFSLLYSGNIGQHHDLETVVEGASELREEEVQFMIIGEGDHKQKIVKLAAKREIRDTTVAFLPYQPLDMLPFSLTSGDVSIVTIRQGFSGLCLSSKLYTAMAAGKPILMVADPDTDEARILEETDAGIRVSPGRSDEVAEAVRTWMSDPELVRRQGKNARGAFEDRFTKDHSLDAYYEILT